jgi:hypothetical protein
MLRRPEIFESPSCATVGGDLWYPEFESGYDTKGSAQVAKSICLACPHKIECAEWGIQKELYGIWGGLTSLDRKRIRGTRGIELTWEDRSA